MTGTRSEAYKAPETRVGAYKEGTTESRNKEESSIFICI
jgi:hypothetical protein